VAVVGRPMSDSSEVPYVDADNEAGARAATEYLYRQGRRRIATITGPQDMAPGVDRLSGYRQALRSRRGVTRLVAQGDFGQASGETAMRELLAKDPELDAVFAASDPMAAGALRALRAAGRRVPDDVAVIGFDDSELARNTDPQLTSVSQPTTLMGRKLAELLIAQLRDKDTKLPPVILPTELVCRESA
jgi:DNA-binding LacI/PurR family transcriptional regulator